MNKKVVLILSDKRSGSTLLESCLASHSMINVVDYTPHSYNETHHWVKSALLLGKHKRLFLNGHRYKGYGGRWSTKMYYYDFIMGNNENCTFDPLKDWENLCSKYTSPIFLEKSPQYLSNWAAITLLLEWIENTQYEVKIIGLIRNPHAVLNSAKNLFKTNANDRQYDWLECSRNLIILSNLLGPTMKVVRYEDLITKSELALSSICEFIGVNFEKSMTTLINKDSLNKWQDSDTYYVNLDDSIIQIGKYFGYNLQNKKTHAKNKEQKWADYMVIFRSSLYYRFFVPIKLFLKQCRK